MNEDQSRQTLCENEELNIDASFIKGDENEAFVHQ